MAKAAEKAVADAGVGDQASGQHGKEPPRPSAVLREVVKRRLADYTVALAELRAEHGILRDQLEPTARAVFGHVLLRHETEIAWHQQLLENVDEFGIRRASLEER